MPAASGRKKPCPTCGRLVRTQPYYWQRHAGAHADRRDPGGRPRKPELTDAECNLARAALGRLAPSPTQRLEAAVDDINRGRPPAARVSWRWLQRALEARDELVREA